MKTTARLIVTYACNRHCPGCCNTIPQEVIRIRGIEELKSYKEIVLTGGEPLLFPNELTNLINKLRAQNNQTKLFLYTAFLKLESYPEIVKMLDGFTVTLHAEASDQDIRDLRKFSNWLKVHKNSLSTDARLFIDTRVYNRYDLSNIDMCGWDVVRKLEWKEECHPADNEELLFFNLKQRSI